MIGKNKKMLKKVINKTKNPVEDIIIVLCIVGLAGIPIFHDSRQENNINSHYDRIIDDKVSKSKEIGKSNSLRNSIYLSNLANSSNESKPQIVKNMKLSYGYKGTKNLLTKYFGKKTTNYILNMSRTNLQDQESRRHKDYAYDISELLLGIVTLSLALIKFKQSIEDGKVKNKHAEEIIDALNHMLRTINDKYYYVVKHNSKQDSDVKRKYTDRIIHLFNEELDDCYNKIINHPQNTSKFELTSICILARLNNRYLMNNNNIDRIYALNELSHRVFRCETKYNRTIDSYKNNKCYSKDILDFEKLCSNCDKIIDEATEKSDNNVQAK